MRVGFDQVGCLHIDQLGVLNEFWRSYSFNYTFIVVHPDVKVVMVVGREGNSLRGKQSR